MPKQVGSSHEWVFDEKDIEKVAMLYEYGLNNKQVAAVMDVHVRTLERKFEDESFAAAVLKARSTFGASYIQSAIKRSQGNEPGAISLMIFLLKTKFGFSEKRIHEIVTNDSKPVLNINLLAGDKKS